MFKPLKNLNSYEVEHQSKLQLIQLNSKYCANYVKNNNIFNFKFGLILFVIYMV